MQTLINYSFFTLILTAFFSSSTTCAGTKTNAKDIIESFYKAYLNADFVGSTKLPALEFSKSFNRLVEKNTKICVEKASTDICGWGADNNIYFDAQEYDPENYKKAGLMVKDNGSGKILVKMNIYPSAKKPEALNDPYYDRSFTFRMVLEGGSWVVDDIQYNKNDTARRRIQREINYYKNQKK
jgi:hypothetical protein